MNRAIDIKPLKLVLFKKQIFCTLRHNFHNIGITEVSLMHEKWVIETTFLPAKVSLLRVGWNVETDIYSNKKKVVTSTNRYS